MLDAKSAASTEASFLLSNFPNPRNNMICNQCLIEQDDLVYSGLHSLSAVTARLSVLPNTLEPSFLANSL
jgi:hypothetical protein